MVILITVPAIHEQLFALGLGQELHEAYAVGGSLADYAGPAKFRYPSAHEPHCGGWNLA